MTSVGSLCIANGGFGGGSPAFGVSGAINGGAGALLGQEILARQGHPVATGMYFTLTGAVGAAGSGGVLVLSGVARVRDNVASTAGPGNAAANYGGGGSGAGAANYGGGGHWWQ